MVCSWREFVQACAGVGIELAWCCTGVAAAAAVPALMLAAATGAAGLGLLRW